jgi:predicted transcriptional regulator
LLKIGPATLARRATNTYHVCMQERVKPKTIASSRMVRKQLFMTADQNRRLKSLAVATGKSEGALIRDGIDALLAREQAVEQDWKAEILQAAGIWADHDQIDTIVRESRDRRRQRRDRIDRQMRGEDP